MADALRNMVRGEVREYEPLSAHTSFGIGGPAEVMVFPLSVEEVRTILSYARECGKRVVVLGHGTNVLAPDGGLDAIVLKTTKLNATKVDWPNLVTGAGVPLGRVLGLTLKAGFTGAEFMAGIPGTVGGAVVMNAGTRLCSMSNVVQLVRVIDPQDLQEKSIDGADAGFRYRGSRIGDEGLIVLEAVLRFSPGSTEESLRQVKELLAGRARTQPVDQPSAGSVFKNPPGASAGALLDRAGCKGLRRGGAVVSTVHANFIVNTGGATAKDVVSLIDEVRDRVARQFGVVLETEIKILG